MRRNRLLCVPLTLLVLWTVTRSRGDAPELPKTPRDLPQRAPELFTAPSCYSYCVSVGLAGGLAGGLVCAGGVIIFLKCTNSITMTRSRGDAPDLPETPRDLPQRGSQRSPSSEERKKGLDDKQDKLQEELQKTNDKVDNLGHKMSASMRRILDNQREQFKLQQEDVEKEIEDTKEKLQSVEKLITESEREKATDKTGGHLREKQKLLKAQWKLEERKEELEKLQLNTEKLLQSEEAEGILTRMIERRKSLENDEEQHNDQLQEIQGEISENQALLSE